TNINNGIVVLKAIWSDLRYTLRFDQNIPVGVEIVKLDETDYTTELYNNESIVAPKITTVVKGHSFKGWDRNSSVATPTYIGGVDLIHGLGRESEGEITLYGIWTTDVAKVITPTGENGEDEEKDITEDIKKPTKPKDKDEYGNDFVYYIIGTISNPNRDRSEEDMTDKELLVKYDEDNSLYEALGDEIDNQATYYSYPIYNNVYNIIIDDNLPEGADEKVVKNIGRDTIYRGDRQVLFDGLDISLKGYKFKGFSSSKTAKEATYKEGDIVRLYADDYVNEKGNVKRLVADQGSKNITLYCVWEANTYSVQVELSPNVVIRNGKRNIVNPKEYGKTYEDLDYDASYFYWSGHDFMYWQIDKILDENGVEIPGYLYDRATISTAAYKNLTDIDKATVVLKVIWSGIRYTIHFDNAIPDGAEIIEENAPIEDVVLHNENELVAPQVNVAIKRYAFRGWDLDRNVATPSYAVGDIIKGLATYENEVVTLYGIWHETKSGSVDPWDPDNETPADDPISSPSEPYDTDDEGNDFLYYIIDSYSDMETKEVTYENGMNEYELLAKFGGDITLHEALGVHLKDDTLYVRYPIYNNVYTIEIDKNIPKEADSRDEFYAETLEQEIYEGDRVRLFSDKTITLDGYKIKGFTSDPTADPVNGEVEYKVGDIVRKYKELSVTDGGLVKRLYADEAAKRIKLYCMWEPNTYSIKYDKGNENVNLRYEKDPNNIKIYGETYKDLSVDGNFMTYEGHEFMFWEVYQVFDKDGVVIDGYKVRRATYSSVDEYKNLSPLDKSTVVLRAVWSKSEYNLSFNDNIPLGAEVVENKPLDNIHVKSTDMILAPYPNTTVKGYSFLGWDLYSGVEIPTYRAGEDYIYGLGYIENEVVTLYGIWQKVEASVVIPVDKGGSGEKIDILEEVVDPVVPYDVDENGNDFLYYIVASISDIEGNVRNEDEMNDKELLAKFGGDKTLSEALGNYVVNGSTYEGLPIYNNVYTIKLDSNIPDGVDRSTYKAEVDEQKIYENDRVRLFENINVSLPGYKLVGFTRNRNNTTSEYKVSDIVRKYKEADTNEKDNVKPLFADESTKTITLYCIWSPIKYYVEIDLGVDKDTINKV
ncbi:MAG: InlB B-repeat-containing protein, partial [Lachnospiraceae bacterium]|nr:InlB B-repeat-containing protein [Lachnospiraceae bacterium]